MRVTERRSALVVVAVELGFPLSLLAWRYSLRHASTVLAAELTPVVHLLPLLAVPLLILIATSLRRLRHGPPPWWWTVSALIIQLALTLVAEHEADTTVLTLVLGCTLLVTVPGPWSWLMFTATIVTGVAMQWTAPAAAMLGLLAHNLFAGAVIYSGVRMGEFAVALRRAQDQLAGLAVVRERARVSRDLHDNLGQELTAIGLRAELAARLVHEAPEHAATEIQKVQHITEKVMDDVRRIARGHWQPVFEDELATGTALLESSGVRCRTRLGAVPGARIAPIAGWALREGITNVLKHSSAHHCLISTEIHDERFRMVIENDGVRRTGPPGTGIAGITDRARGLGGHVWSGRVASRRFRLVLEIPDGE
ncbi:sensor histidine kinase [Amycolatopsis sp. NPDC059021]|uniref:sensor histidine kinase n=1 Tax=Amycolatopsis sp. NPDC059021 TaxID=3346704 RepID=UPI00366B71F8